MVISKQEGTRVLGTQLCRLTCTQMVFLASLGTQLVEIDLQRSLTGNHWLGRATGLISRS